MAAYWPPKFTDEVLDYTVDFTARLAGDTIASAVVSLLTPAGVTIATQTNTATTVTAWFSGGVPGQTCNVNVKVVTVAGRTFEVKIPLLISETQ